jgi:hypothetical protein
MAGLVPAIYVLLAGCKDVDARDKPGHDDVRGDGIASPLLRLAMQDNSDHA